MTRQRRFHSRVVLVIAGSRATLLSALVGVVLATAAVQTSSAQTYHVIYNFSGCGDGGFPTSTLVMDRGGSLYGSTESGGSSCAPNGGGVVYRLKPAGNGWLEAPLHTFSGSTDGSVPANYDGLTIGPEGALYGTTTQGGAGTQGIVFRLRPPAHFCATVLCPWSEDIVYNFHGGSDGSTPFSSVIFDAGGTMYGTTSEGGFLTGAVYGISHDGNGWSESVLSNVDGFLFAGLTMDHAGNFYGVSYEGGLGAGAVFELTNPGSGWTSTSLYRFGGWLDGANPLGGLVMDPAGNLFGSTFASGVNGGGTIFELSPANGSWTFSVIYSLQGGSGPASTLTMDAVGNLYGTTVSDGAFQCGSVFRLSPSGGSWTYTSLHDFQCGSDGIAPVGGVVIDASGNLYGTAAEGGANNQGLIWEITPH